MLPMSQHAQGVLGTMKLLKIALSTLLSAPILASSANSALAGMEFSYHVIEFESTDSLDTQSLEVFFPTEVRDAQAMISGFVAEGEVIAVQTSLLPIYDGTVELATAFKTTNGGPGSVQVVVIAETEDE